MTQTLAVNANNDLYLNPQGNIAVVYALQATLQACMHAARTILGEMVLQTDRCIPYFQNVFVGVPNIQQFQAALRVAWLQVADVVEVSSLTTQQVGNTLTYEATIITDYGTGAING